MSVQPAEIIRNGPLRRFWLGRWHGAEEVVRTLICEIERLEGIPASAILSPSRGKKPIAEARFAVMYTAHCRGHSTTSIAKALGRADHTTVINGVRKANELRRTDPGFAALLGCLEAA